MTEGEEIRFKGKLYIIEQVHEYKNKPGYIIVHEKDKKIPKEIINECDYNLIT